MVGLFPVLLGVVAIAALLVLGGVFPIFPSDEWALLKLRQLRGGWLDDAAVFAYSVGIWGFGLPWIPLVVVAGLMTARRWAEALFLVVALLPSVINIGLKELVARPRPDAALALLEETGYAFPSGHAVFAAAFFGALIYLGSRWSFLGGNAAMRRLVQLALVLLAAAVGLSRVYLGVHWPSDVIAGYLIGAFWLAVMIAIYRRVENGRPAHHDCDKGSP